MTRNNGIRIFGLSALLVAAAVGCAAEQTNDFYGDETGGGAQIVGLGSDGEELPSGFDSSDRPVQKKHIVDPTRSTCPGCGPVPDPWKSVLGPVPDPWQTKNNTGSSGTDNNGSNKKP